MYFLHTSFLPLCVNIFSCNRTCVIYLLLKYSCLFIAALFSFQSFSPMVVGFISQCDLFHSVCCFCSSGAVSSLLLLTDLLTVSSLALSSYSVESGLDRTLIRVLCCNDRTCRFCTAARLLFENWRRLPPIWMPAARNLIGPFEGSLAEGVGGRVTVWTTRLVLLRKLGCFWIEKPSILIIREVWNALEAVFVAGLWWSVELWEQVLESFPPALTHLSAWVW
jgi:hypothetical protein